MDLLKEALRLFTPIVVFMLGMVLLAYGFIALLTAVIPPVDGFLALISLIVIAVGAALVVLAAVITIRMEKL